MAGTASDLPRSVQGGSSNVPVFTRDSGPRAVTSPWHVPGPAPPPPDLYIAKASCFQGARAALSLPRSPFPLLAEGRRQSVSWEKKT